MSTPLEELQERIRKAHPENEVEQDSILQELRALGPKGAEPGLLGHYLQSAELLQAYQVKLGSVGGDIVKGLLERVLRLASLTQEEDGDSALAEEVTEDPAGARGRLLSNLLLGEILLRRGEVKEADVEAALELQSKTGLRFGEALVKLGAAAWPAVEDALSYQDRCRHMVENFVDLPGVDERGPGTRMPSAEEIASVRAELETRGSDRDARPETPIYPLHPEHGLRAADPDLELISDLVLGEILLRQNLIGAAQLEEALAVQRASGIRIGEALVQTGHLRWSDVEYAIRLQGEMRRYA